MSLLSALLNDIQLIVFKYIHRHYYRAVIQNYNNKIQQHWCDDGNQFDLAIVLNFRDLNTYEYDRHPIFSFDGIQRSYLLPLNYIYSLVWLPVDMNIITHEAYRINRNTIKP